MKEIGAKEYIEFIKKAIEENGWKVADNVYSILDDSVSSKEDDEVTICFEFNDREYYRDIKKEWITSINVF